MLREFYLNSDYSVASRSPSCCRGTRVATTFPPQRAQLHRVAIMTTATTIRTVFVQRQRGMKRKKKETLTWPPGLCSRWPYPDRVHSSTSPTTPPSRGWPLADRGRRARIRFQILRLTIAAPPGTFVVTQDESFFCYRSQNRPQKIIIEYVLAPWQYDKLPPEGGGGHHAFNLFPLLKALPP